MKRKKEEQVLSPKIQELEKMVDDQTSFKMADKNKDKLKGYKGIKRLSKYYLKHKKSCAIIIINFLLVAVINFLVPIYSAKSLASLTIADFHNCIVFALVVLGLCLVSKGFNYFFQREYIIMNSRLMFDLRQDLMRAVNDTTMSKIDKTNSGVFIDRITSDAGTCSNVILEIFLTVIDLLSSFCFFVYIAFLNIWIFLAFLVFLVAVFLIDTYQMKVWFKGFRGIRKRREIAMGSYTEQVRGVRDIKSLNIKEAMLEDSGEKYGYVLEKNKKEEFRQARIKILFRSSIVDILEMAVLIFGIVLIKHDILTLTAFLVVYFYRSHVLSLSKILGNMKQKVTNGELCAQRVFEVIDTFPKEHFGNDELPENFVGKIDFEDVEFGYEEGNKILKGVSFEIEPNKTTAIVGKSGCGKSTILSLINNLYVKDKGCIKIDGVEIGNLSENALRNAVGVVTQNPYIFNASIRNNLLYVKPDATEEEMWNALKLAQIDTFIRTLDQGLDSMVGENGVMLSGGQKQRLAIARVLLKNSKIIVFDEATSALDNKSQGSIVKELEKLKSNHTILVVAHRLSTIVDADKIIVIDDGKKIAEGAHKSLMRNCSIYKDLYESEESASVI